MIVSHMAGEKPAVNRRSVWWLRVLVILGVIALGYYYSWWGIDGRMRSPWFALALLVVVIYSMPQLLGNWLLYVAARRQSPPPTPLTGTTIDVFVTACGEPRELIEQGLRAACSMRGDHHTWLLDDGQDQSLARLAESLGVGYLTRSDRTDAKAGNINAALACTSGDIVAIFDVDHVPRPDFLERTTGYFRDPRIGFVQVMLSFTNSKQSWVAQSAVETSLDFYNPTSMGMGVVGGATMMGSNALIRRRALTSIGGYRPGLAEDLATSLALHAAGWRSAYVAEPLAPGLAPSDLAAWFTQQLKWSRGVFEVLLTAYPSLFRYLTWGQRLAYAVRMTYYWAGPVVCAHIMLTLLVLFGGSTNARASFHQYLLHLAPLGLFSLFIRHVALRTWRHTSVRASLLGKPVTLVFASWPVYTVAWMMSLLRVPWAFRPTPKSPAGVLNPMWMLPQTLSLLLLGSGLLYSFTSAERGLSYLVLLFVLFQATPQFVLFRQGYRKTGGQQEGAETSTRSTRVYQSVDLAHFTGEQYNRNPFGIVSLFDQQTGPGVDSPEVE